MLILGVLNNKMNYQTRNYEVVVGQDKEKDNTPYYTVVNKETGVVEYEDNILPRTLDATKNLQTLHDEAVENFIKKDAIVLTIAGEGDGQQSTH